MTSADYSDTMRRRHRFVLVLLPLLLVVPAVRAAVGSKNQGAPSVKGNRYTRFCNSCSAGPDRPESSAKSFNPMGRLSARRTCEILTAWSSEPEPAAFVVFAKTNKEFLYLSSKSPNYHEHLLTWCIFADVPANAHELFSFLFYLTSSRSCPFWAVSASSQLSQILQRLS